MIKIYFIQIKQYSLTCIFDSPGFPLGNNRNRYVHKWYYTVSGLYMRAHLYFWCIINWFSGRKKIFFMIIISNHVVLQYTLLENLLDLILKPRMVYCDNKNEILKHRKLIPNKSWSNMIYSMFNACGQTMLILRYDVFKRKMWPYGLCQNNGRFSFKTFFGSNKKFE